MTTDATLTETKLNDAQWQIADAIARQLVIDGTDVNELRKAIAYLRAHLDREQAGKYFFDYLKTLVRQGKTIGHSKRTIEYYRSLDEVCSQYLANYQDAAPVMLHLLGWAARLVQYYEKGVPTGEISKPEVISEREAEIKAIAEANTFELGQFLDATIASIRGNKVTYELLGSIRLTVKEPKKIKDLEESFDKKQKVRIKITQLKDDGSPKKG